MSKRRRVSVNVSVDALGPLAILFVVLKLARVIDWSWWWVLAPLWAPTAVVLIVLMLTGLACSVYLVATRP